MVRQFYWNDSNEIAIGINNNNWSNNNLSNVNLMDICSKYYMEAESMNNENKMDKMNETNNSKLSQRVVVSMSATPKEILNGLNDTINWILSKEQTYKIDAFYLQIPYMQIRNDNKLYPKTSKLKLLFPQKKVIINRLFVDYGPMSRYIGIMDKEIDPETIIITFDIDIRVGRRNNNFISTLVKHIEYDPNSWWSFAGENPIFSASKKEVTHIEWERFPIHYDDQYKIAWDKRTIFRAVNGIAIKRRFLDNLWYNATEYYLGCFWDDDHWMSFNLEIKGIPIKIIQKYYRNHTNRKHRRLGSLSNINNNLNSAKVCTTNIMRIHPFVWNETREWN